MSKISLIIPVYNNSRLLLSTLRSIALQTTVPYEIIVADDGSSEDIESLLKENIALITSHLTYIKQSDQGFRPGKCKNHAVKLAQGEILVFFDQDIISTNGYLSMFKMKHLIKHFLVAYPARLNVHQTKTVMAELEQNHIDFNITNKQRYKLIKQYFKDNMSLYIKSLLKSPAYKPKLRGGVFGLRKDVFEKVNGFDENYQGWGREDDDLGRRLNSLGYIGKSVFLREYTMHLYHPIHPTQKSDLNQQYYQNRKKEIRDGDFEAKNGLRNPLDDEEIYISRLK